MQSKILRIILVSFICFPLAGEESSSNLCAEGYIEEEGEYCVKNLYKPADRRKGLMYVDYLPPNHIVKFHFQNLSTKCFWMRNTSIPLDIKFIGSNSEIIEKGIPFSEKSICHRAKLLVEANRGELIGSRQYGKRY